MPGGVQGTGAFWCAGDPGTGDRRNAAKSGLAAWAPESDPLLARVALFARTDRGPAATAGPTGPPVGPGLLAAPLRARRDDARPFLVGIQQSLPEFHESTQVCHLADRPPRAEPAQEQHFCSKYIADHRPGCAGRAGPRRPAGPGPRGAGVPPPPGPSPGRAGRGRGGRPRAARRRWAGSPRRPAGNRRPARCRWRGSALSGGRRWPARRRAGPARSRPCAGGCAP